MAKARAWEGGVRLFASRVCRALSLLLIASMEVSCANEDPIAAPHAFSGCSAIYSAYLDATVNCLGVRLPLDSFIQSTCAPLQALVEKGTVTYDPAAAAACAAWVESAGCAATPCAVYNTDYGCSPLGGSVPSGSPCIRVFVGKLAGGASCTTNVECQSTECDKGSGGDVRCPGVCLVPVAEGGDCSDFQNTSCAAGLSCLQPGAAMGPQICARAMPLGGDCSHAFCEVGTYCDEDVTGKCVAATASGPCTGASWECLAGSSCSATSNRCVPQGRSGAPCSRPADCITNLESCVNGHCMVPSAVAVGQPCPSDVPTLCDAASYCLTPDGQSSGTCTPRKALGAACSPEGDMYSCVAGATCLNGTCQTALCF